MTSPKHNGYLQNARKDDNNSQREPYLMFVRASAADNAKYVGASNDHAGLDCGNCTQRIAIKDGIDGAIQCISFPSSMLYDNELQQYGFQDGDRPLKPTEDKISAPKTVLFDAYCHIVKDSSHPKSTSSASSLVSSSPSSSSSSSSKPAMNILTKRYSCDPNI